jgi:two-component system cell cycle response regulator
MTGAGASGEASGGASAGHCDDFFRAADEAFLIVGADGRVALANPAAERLVDAAPGGLAGRALADLLVHGDALAARIAAAAGEAGPVRHEGRLRRGPSRTLPVDLSAFPFGDGARVGLIVADRSERRQLEIARRRAMRHLHLLAETDALTGLPNRRAAIDALERLAATVLRHRRDAHVAIVDVDHFKAINDTWGHAVGDDVLLGLGARCAANLRGGDLIGRIGGEEFLVLMPETDRRAALEAMERLRRIVAASPIQRADGAPPAVPVRISIGVAPIRGIEGGAHDALKEADAALYAAKEGGRDRVSIAPA